MNFCLLLHWKQNLISKMNAAQFDWYGSNRGRILRCDVGKGRRIEEG